MRVCPGLSIRAYVTYTFKRPSLLRAIIPIEVNGKVFDYRVTCTLAVEGISIEPKSIDFGIIDIGYSSGLKIITIRNEGGKRTRYIRTRLFFTKFPDIIRNKITNPRDNFQLSDDRCVII